MDFNLSVDGRLTDAQTTGEASVKSPLTTGAASGEYCVIWCGPDFPTDQRQDDANSLCFDSEPLTAPMSLLGACELRVKMISDKSCGQIIVRLC